MNSFQFTVYDLTGTPKYSYAVEEKNLTTQVPKATQKHHIIIIDRSGSMYYSMPDLKESIKKTLALHEYHDDSMLVSLLSYSSCGDLTTHFVAKPISKIDMREIDNLRATSMTCISQSLVAVRNLINKNHVTGITLHSDGFANDPSSFSEKRAVFDACDQLAKENVFINTVAHSDYADFQLLSSVANKVSGRCVRATGIKQLYDSIVQTFDALKNGALAVSKVTLDGSEYAIYLSPDEKKIIGSSIDFDLSGVDSSKPGKIYTFTKNNKQNLPVCQNHPAIFAFARAKLAEGNINVAKYVLASTGDVALFNANWKASTVPDLAKMAASFEAIAFGEAKSVATMNGPVKIDDSVTVVKVLQYLEKNKSGIVLSVDSFLKGYDRRGVKRIVGTRDENGNLVEPDLETEVIGEKNKAVITGLDVSTTSANISINTYQKVRLVRKTDKTPILSVAGISVESLQAFRSYTIVGDGELTVDVIPVFINDKKAFEEVSNLGVLYQNGTKASKFDFSTEYQIVLKDLAITKVSVDAGNLQSIINDFFVAKIIASLSNAVVKEESDRFTAEQIEELKKHYLSKNLYLNFPTTNEYASLEDAINTGKIDVRNSFKIKFGTEGLLGFDSFRSANAFLERTYEPSFNGEYDCSDILTEKTWIEKKLSAKSKTSAADVVQKKVFDFVLGISKADCCHVISLLEAAGALNLAKIIENGGIKSADKDQLVKAFSEANRAIEAYMQSTYMNNIFPVVFFIGSFGMAPDEWDAVAMTADALKQQWPEAKIGKAETEGTFFKTGEVVFGVTSEKRYVSIIR